MEPSLVASCSGTIFLTPLGALVAAFLLDNILMLIMRGEVVGLSSTRVIVLITGVAKLKPQAEVCFAITHIQAEGSLS